MEIIKNKTTELSLGLKLHGMFVKELTSSYVVAAEPDVTLIAQLYYSY